MQACIQVCPKNPDNFNVDNVRVAKLLGGGLHDSTIVRGMVLKSDTVGTIKRVEKAKVSVLCIPCILSRLFLPHDALVILFLLVWFFNLVWLLLFHSLTSFSFLLLIFLRKVLYIYVLQCFVSSESLYTGSWVLLTDCDSGWWLQKRASFVLLLVILLTADFTRV